MKFELKPVDKKPERTIKKTKRTKKPKHDELEIEYIKRITGVDIRPSGVK